MNPVSFMLPGCMATLLILVITSPGCQGHGRFMKPPSRASMFRIPGWDAVGIPDWQDNQNSCGGVDTQYRVNEGRCGICGDPFNADPKEHEAGGTWGQGIITAQYEQAQTIEVQVEITSHHKGWMEFRICHATDANTEVTQDCLDEHVMGLASDVGVTRQDITDGRTGLYTYQLQLPYGMVCDHCVIQWRYHAGNSWGCDKPGEPTIAECAWGAAPPCCALGLGNQEEFYGCADVRIVEDLSVVVPLTTPAPVLEYIAPVENAPEGDCTPVNALVAGMTDWCQNNCYGNCRCP